VVLVVALIVVVVLVAAGGVWYWKAHNSLSNPLPSSTAQNTPYIDSLSPSSTVAFSQGGNGSASTVLAPPLEITIFGSGFTATGNTVNFVYGPINNLASIDGKTITFNFTKSQSQLAQCTGTSMEVDFCEDIPVGMYPVSVSNADGMSNEITFIVTSSSEVTNITNSTVSSINTSTWKTYDNGVFEYPPDWSAINGADLGNFADAAFSPSGSLTSITSVTIGSRGCRPGPSAATSSIVISGKTVTRIDGPNEISICENATSSDGPGGGWSFDFGFDSTTTKAIDEAIISTLNLSNW